jgi:hypothetical protein
MCFEQGSDRLHGAESFLRSRQSLSYSRISQRFMETEGSLPCSQDRSTVPYPEPDQSSPYRLILSKSVHTACVRCTKSHISSGRLSRESVRSTRPCVTFHNKIISYGEELLAARTTPQAGVPPLVGSPRPLILNIFAATSDV